jgi:hypothetical protein
MIIFVVYNMDTTFTILKAEIDGGWKESSYQNADMFIFKKRWTKKVEELIQQQELQKPQS